MHELGIMIEIVKTVEDFARDNALDTIDTLVLQVGEASPVIPRFLRAVYSAAVDATLLQETKLEIEILPANGLCRACGTVHHLSETHGVCPRCGAENYELLSGREFLIKEILVPE